MIHQAFYMSYISHTGRVAQRLERLPTVPNTTVWDPPRTNGWKLAHCPPRSKWGSDGNAWVIKAARKGTVHPTSKNADTALLTIQLYFFSIIVKKILHNFYCINDQITFFPSILVCTGFSYHMPGIPIQSKQIKSNNTNQIISHYIVYVTNASVTQMLCFLLVTKTAP